MSVPTPNVGTSTESVVPVPKLTGTDGTGTENREPIRVVPVLTDSDTNPPLIIQHKSKYQNL